MEQNYNLNSLFFLIILGFFNPFYSTLLSQETGHQEKIKNSKITNNPDEQIQGTIHPMDAQDNSVILGNQDSLSEDDIELLAFGLESHLEEAHFSLTEIYKKASGDPKAKVIISDYTNKFNQLFPGIEIKSLIKLEVSTFIDWLNNHQHLFEHANASKEIFAVAESDLIELLK